MGDNGKNGNGRLYHVYRDAAGGDLAALIGPALADHHDRYGCLPPALAVHKTMASKARLALDGLEVALVDVVVCGGTLVGECWLQSRENGHKRPFPLARVAAAQADVMPERASSLALQPEPPQKQCSKCQEWKSTDEFYDRGNTGGKNSKCKNCVRARLRVGRLLILNRDEFRCIYCGKSSVEDAAQLHVDHVIPRAGSGGDTAGNLVTSCARCNLEKAARPLGEKSAARILAEVARRNSEHGIQSQTTIKL